MEHDAVLPSCGRKPTLPGINELLYWIFITSGCNPPQALSASSRLTTSLRLLPVASVFPYLGASFGVSWFLFSFTMENLAPPNLAPPYPALNTASKDAPSLSWWRGYVTNEKLSFPCLIVKLVATQGTEILVCFWERGKSNLLLQQFRLVPLVTVPTVWSCSLWIQSSSQLEEEMGSWQRPLCRLWSQTWPKYKF